MLCLDICNQNKPFSEIQFYYTNNGIAMVCSMPCKHCIYVCWGWGFYLCLGRRGGGGGCNVLRVNPLCRAQNHFLEPIFDWSLALLPIYGSVLDRLGELGVTMNSAGLISDKVLLNFPPNFMAGGSRAHHDRKETGHH